MYQNTRRIFYLPSASPPLPILLILSITFSSKINPLGIECLIFLPQALDSGFTVTWGQRLRMQLWSQNWEFGNPCGENCATETKIKNQRWQNFCLHQLMSKCILKKDPSLPLRMWDAYHPPNTLGTLLLSAAGGRGSHRLQTFVFAWAKNQPSHVMLLVWAVNLRTPATTAALRGGGRTLVAWGRVI